jgi:transposase
MIIDFTEFRFFIRPGVTDLRKAVNGLTLLVQNEMGNDPFAKSLFLFCNRQRKLLKIVYWDKNGFCLWQKRLEKQKFPWPRTTEEAREISFEQLLMLLEGIDFFKAHKELSFSRV